MGSLSAQTLEPLAPRGGPFTRLAAALGLGRTGVGLLCLARPTAFARLAGADKYVAKRVTWLTRMFGAREVALGLGTAKAARSGHGLTAWATAAAMSDAGDVAALSLAIRDRNLNRLAAGQATIVAATAFALGVAAVAESRRDG